MNRGSCSWANLVCFNKSVWLWHWNHTYCSKAPLHDSSLTCSNKGCSLIRMPWISQILTIHCLMFECACAITYFVSSCSYVFRMQLQLVNHSPSAVQNLLYVFKDLLLLRQLGDGKINSGWCARSSWKGKLSIYFDRNIRRCVKYFCSLAMKVNFNSVYL